MSMPYEDDCYDPTMMMMMMPNPNLVECVETDEMYMSDSQVRFPSALEKALDLKSERIRERVAGEPIPEDEENEEFFEAPLPAETRSDDEDYDNDLDNEDQIETDSKSSGKDKKEKNKRKRKKRKKKKKHSQETPEQQQENKENEVKPENGDTKADTDKEKDPEVEIEYVQEHVNVNELAPMYRQFARILDAFKISDGSGAQVDISKEIKLAQELGGKKDHNELKKVPKLPDEFDEDEAKQDGDQKEKMSKRKMKRLTRLSVAELKQLVSRPDVVEMHDVTARDPRLLVHLKAYRNTVPVPRHWCFKRKYLQGKRGIEKPPFDLPDFIKKTGIMEMRSSLTEKDDQKTLKAKMRERARPKMGKIDIDYQKLHDAFFKWQTKPKLTIHGDLYYEGKEYETRLREKKPGDLSDELRTALGMPVGPNAHKVPPPWLIAMQRYGPPPSYPNLKIPGLNVPIPDGCSFGYHAGGWGKPPVDETGKPLYGDVFGIQSSSLKIPEIEIEVDKSLWGELESESEDESEEEEEEEEEQEEPDETGMVTPAEGLVTPSGMTSIPAGIHTPENIELRKRKIESDMEGETPVLYQVLPEKKLDKVTGMMGSTHVYDVPTAIPVNAISSGGRRQDGSTVELALDPSELDLVDTEAMQARYEAQIREQQSHLQKEDLSDVVADHIRQKAKRKKPQQQEKSTKKYKEFKF